MNWEYRAGFFDGEGNVFFPPYKKNIERHNVMIRIYQSEPRKLVLQEIQTFLGYGKLLTRKQRFFRKKDNTPISPMSEIYIQRAEDVLSFIIGVYPYCIVKRYKLQMAFVRLEACHKLRRELKNKALFVEQIRKDCGLYDFNQDKLINNFQS